MADDRDIKIYVKKDNEESGEFDALSEDIRRHISNGNKDKAVRLGSQMAAIKPEDGAVNIDTENLPAAELYQIRVLFTFVAEYAVRRNISDDFLADTVSAAMYDYLKTNEKGYYDNISDGGAFTFYLLALNKDGDIAENIGEQFANRLSINNDEIRNFGAKIFSKSYELFEKMIKNADFRI
ncbi:MAG: hypothetical protein PUB20_01180 [Clostridia bacterium]|nr:hypothetical protein [Clostridia bacterium]